MTDPGILSLIADEERSLDSFRAAGGKVLGSLCWAFPPGIAAGLGMRPVRIFPPVSAGRHSDRFIRPDACPLVRAALGAAAAREGIFARTDLLAGMYTCDQVRRMFQGMEDLAAIPIHHLQLPSTRTAEAGDWFAAQVERVVGDIGGGRYDEEAAAGWERASRRASRAIMELAAGARAAPTELLSLSALADVGRPEVVMRGAAMAGRGEVRTGPRVALAGSPVAPEDDFVPGVLEELGASMVPLHCSGRMIPLPEEPASGAPGELAREYFGALRCARCRPDAETMSFLAGAVDRYGCSGLILKALKFCDLWFSQRERLKEMLRVPVLVLDTGYSPGEEARLSTRIEAFLEEIT